MLSEVWNAFATTSVHETDRTGDATSVRDIELPVCIDCLARIMNRPTADVVYDVMAAYASFDVRLDEAGHCRVCARRTVVVS
jgi:hypothetical protein